MYQDQILNILEIMDKPSSIGEARSALARTLGRTVSYETTKKDLLTLAAKGLINCKSIGKGKRITWIFWSKTLGTRRAGPPGKTNDPFEISVAERDSMTSEELVSLYDHLTRDYGDLIQAELRRGSRYVVLCDRRVAKTSNDEPSHQEIRDLEQKLGGVCYVLTQDRIEESPWAPVDGGDYYPTVELLLGNNDWEDADVFVRGLRLISDFDTGNADIAAFSNEDVSLIEPTQTGTMRRAFHLGKHYDYFLATLKIGIRDASGTTRCVQKASRRVLSWSNPDSNPFLLANHERKAFVGRDLMLSIPFSILLSGRNKRSKVLLE